jgi:hypothetical protein
MKGIAERSLSLLAAFLLSAASRSPIPTTVCELLSHPPPFNGRSVSFEATVRPGRHFTLLFDSRCPEHGVALLIPERIRGERSVEAFSRAVWFEYPKHPNRKVTAQLQGIFSLHHGSVPQWVLELESVTIRSVTE